MLSSGAAGEATPKSGCMLTYTPNHKWTNKHLLPLQVEDKQKEPEMTPRLKALVKWVTELRQAGLEVCHYAEEFTLRRIRPLGHREKLAFECSWLADPNRDPLAGKILNLLLLSMHQYCDLISLLL
jgi:hypothetical protein